MQSALARLRPLVARQSTLVRWGSSSASATAGHHDAKDAHHDEHHHHEEYTDSDVRPFGWTVRRAGGVI